MTAGWTTAGDLPARWVIHTVGPNYSAGQNDRAVLASCYTRALQVADELGARSIAFPLISAGAYSWPRRDAAIVAVDTIAASRTSVDEVQLVAIDQEAYEEIDRILARSTPLRILQGVRVLHQRNQAVRVMPGMSPSGMHWRVAVTAADNISHTDRYPTLRDWDRAINYTTGAGTKFAGARVTLVTSPDEVADIILDAMPSLRTVRPDLEYAKWYDDLLSLAERHDALPIAYADYFDSTLGWEVGWGSGLRHHHPPAPPR